MKLISDLDVNGKSIINGDFTLLIPSIDATETIATQKDIKDEVGKLGGVFSFKGDATSISLDKTTITVDGVDIVADSTNTNHSYQIEDKEYASNGEIWVELGLNLQKSSDENDGLMSKENYSKLSGIASGAQVNTIDRIKVNNNVINPDEETKTVNIYTADRIFMQTETNVQIHPNILNKWDRVESLTVSFYEGVQGRANEYELEFTVDSDNFTLNLPNTVRWSSEPSWESGYTYQVSIMNDLAVFAEWED